jgi:hypothetical protein
MSYFLTLLVIALSGNPIFRLYNLEMIYVMFSLLLFFIAVNRNMLHIYKSRAFVVTAALVIGLFIVQYIDTKYNQVNASIGFLLKLFIIYSVIRLVKGFEIIFVKLLYYIALTSLFIFALHMFYPKIEDMGVVIMGENESYFYHKSLYVYTFLIDGLQLRNSGMFSEPGLFSGTINAGIIVLLALKKKFQRKQYNKYLIVFFVTIITTYSTQGYLILALLSVYIAYQKINGAFVMTKFSRVATVLGLIVLFFLLKYAFEEIPFLYQKIQGQSALVSNEEHNYEITRWGGFLTSLQYVYERPLWGWGIDVLSAINANHSQKAISSGTGMTDIILKLGLPFFLFLSNKVYLGFSIMFRSKAAAVFFLITFLLLIQGEPFFNFPLIYLFYFIGFKKKLVMSKQAISVPKSKKNKDDFYHYPRLQQN